MTCGAEGYVAGGYYAFYVEGAGVGPGVGVGSAFAFYGFSTFNCRILFISAASELD